jgi:3-hydroxyisobutyrate dehydrogenase
MTAGSGQTDDQPCGAIAVIGTGAIGSRIARRLSDTGWQVVVWNRSPAASRSLADAGVATVASTPAEAAGQSAATIITVSDPAALISVSEGRDGIAAATAPGSSIVVMSTVGGPAAQRLAAAAPDASVVDAPFLGSLVEAEHGRLRIFVGAARHAFDRVEPLLGALGTPTLLGEVGAGSAAKLVANCALLGTVALLGETIALADQLGLARQTTFEVLATTVLAEQAARRRSVIDDGRYPRRYRLSLAAKDADLMLDSAQQAPRALRLLHAVRSWLRTAGQDGRNDDDYLAVLATILSARECSGAR